MSFHVGPSPAELILQGGRTVGPGAWEARAEALGHFISTGCILDWWSGAQCSERLELEPVGWAPPRLKGHYWEAKPDADDLAVLTNVRENACSPALSPAALVESSPTQPWWRGQEHQRLPGGARGAPPPGSSSGRPERAAGPRITATAERENSRLA